MAKTPSNPLTHFDEQGQAHMVSVDEKAETARMARAQARITMAESTFVAIEAGKVSKGDVLAVARLAAIMASKSTSTLIPLCHPVRITAVNVDFELGKDRKSLDVIASVFARDRTGPEMEAMSAASTAVLTIYDMCKSMDRGMRIESLHLVEKSGGKSGHWKAEFDAKKGE